MQLTASEIDAFRSAADITLQVFVDVGLPLVLAWAVRKGLIQARWVSVVQGAAGAALAAGNASGKSVDHPAFRKAAEDAALAYFKSQAADVLRAKGMTDDQAIEAGMARVSIITGGVIGPNGSAVAAPPSPVAAAFAAAPSSTLA